MKSLHPFSCDMSERLLSTSSNSVSSDMHKMFGVFGRKCSSIHRYKQIWFNYSSSHVNVIQLRTILSDLCDKTLSVGCAAPTPTNDITKFRHFRFIHVSCVMFESELRMFIWNKIPNIISVVLKWMVFFLLLFSLSLGLTLRIHTHPSYKHRRH